MRISSTGGRVWVFLFSFSSKTNGPSIAGGSERARALLLVEVEVAEDEDEDEEGAKFEKEEYEMLGDVRLGVPTAPGVGGCGSTMSGSVFKKKINNNKN
jgi:hypothetical protein